MKDFPDHIGQIPPERVYAALHTGPEGLNPAELAERWAHVGPNSFEVVDKWKLLRILGRQFTNFFAILLIISALICFIAQGINPGEGMAMLGWALTGVALLNALFSFFQEYRAEKAMAALKKFLPHLVEVSRQGRISRIPAVEIVPGDVVILSEGDKIAADMRIVAAEGLMIDNAPLTGESVAVRLSPKAQQKSLEECDNIAFAGCTVVKGTGRGVVFATGLRTRFGRIAHLSQTIRRGDSPLEREISRMIRILTTIACTMGFSFFLYGVLSGKSLWINLVFMMGIIVANVPEGLLPTLTVALVMGSLRMAEKKVLVTSLNAVEALGAVHVVCTDKTGTLTLNRLTITQMIDPLSGEAMSTEQQRRVITFALCASDVRQTASQLLGDPLDVAVARHLLNLLPGKLAETQQKIQRSFAFDVEKRRSAGIYTDRGELYFVTKGAFEALRPMVTAVSGAAATEISRDIPLAQQLADSEEIMQRLAARGLRVIAVAGRRISAQEADACNAPEGAADPLEHDLVLVGLIGVEDPVRTEVPQAVATCHTAGIQVMMITGDHPATALAVAEGSGIVPPGCREHLTGEQLRRLTVSGLVDHLRQGVRVFARTTPEQKMKIVTALKSMDMVVAMTGDGVNDAPALKAADVGIAMGKMGTDVARESAQIILLDDNFAHIVDGIEEGRTVFLNMKKFTNYVLVSNGPEILPYLLYIVLPLPLALNIIHILSIDLGTDIIPSMGLGQEPPDPEVMRRPPRVLAEGLLTPRLILHSYGFLGLLEGLWSLFLFFYVLRAGGWRYGMDLPPSSALHRAATGITLASIFLMQIGNLVGRRSLRQSGLDRGIFHNKLILAGILIQIFFAWGVLYFAPLQQLMNTGPVDLEVFALAWLGIFWIFALDYLRKVLNRPKDQPSRNLTVNAHGR